LYFFSPDKPIWLRKNFVSVDLFSETKVHQRTKEKKSWLVSQLFKIPFPVLQFLTTIKIPVQQKNTTVQSWASWQVEKQTCARNCGLLELDEKQRQNQVQNY
jgi:hypothetical protein